MANLAGLIGALDDGGRGSLYAKLRDALRDAIDRGVLKPQEALPAERDMAQDFGISRITVRKALDSLVADGLLTRRQGAGTFVAGRVEKQFSKLSSFSEDMAARGRSVRSEWLHQAEGAVTPDEALMLGLSPGSAVYRFNRIRYADELPMALEHAVIPGFALSGLDVVGRSLYAALQDAGMRPVRALQRLRAVSFDADQAKLLGIEPGAPGLFIERRGFLDDGRAVEATQSWYRGDAYDFVAELNTRA
ncbi:GntR family transcriptional regulator [Novosphingobium sp. 9U]|uniref:GntR family transcriptional regulator n=1 Tax=Novosphingobium sp. 9U TaxID=2653158 RepID=UPI0012F14AF8|nr:GntR family transcriptional regulator [Novosphingobium sp. 9U]VWX46714.1 Predicted transcriptional regulator of N-Acetylglucosamine utilization, GntR family [Novosphingobium sp. 9U]